MSVSLLPPYKYTRLTIAGFDIFHIHYNQILTLVEFDKQLDELQEIFDDIPVNSNLVVVISYDSNSKRQDSLLMSMNKLRKQILDSQRKGKIFRNIYVIAKYTVPLNILFYLIESLGIIKMVAITSISELKSELTQYNNS